MSKKMLIAGVCVMALLLLVGCQADKKSADDKATESATSPFSASSEDTATETEEAIEEEADGVINEVNSKDTEIVEKVAEAEENCGNVSDNVEKGQTKKSTGSAEGKQSGSTGQSENSDQSLSQSVSPKSTEQSATHISTEQETPQPTASKQTEELKPNIDIDAQVSYAKSYAESIGLTLDSTATDCWDNPITVNAGKADVKGDIKSRLNRYKNTEGFTSVWVWAVKISDTEYELYIGYA